MTIGDSELNNLLNISRIISEEAKGLSVISEWEEYFSKRYDMPLADVMRCLRDWKEYITIPATAFQKSLGGLETVIVFLHEHHKLTFSEISRIIARDPRTVWTAYRKAKGKVPFWAKPRPTKVHIPVLMFQDRKHTVMEIACHVLKRHFGMSNRRIAKTIERSDSFVWITLKRYDEKQ